MSNFVKINGDSETFNENTNYVDLRSKLVHLYRIRLLTPTQLSCKAGIADISFYCMRGNTYTAKKEVLLQYFKTSTDNTIVAKDISSDTQNTDLSISYKVTEDSNGRDVYLDIYATTNFNYSYIYSQIVFSTYPTFIEDKFEIVDASSITVINIE